MALTCSPAKSGRVPLATPSYKTSSRRGPRRTSRSALPRPFSDMGTGILRAPKLVLSDAERIRLDESPDANFYATPRLMQHADDAWLDALTSIYAHILPHRPCVLELCASAHSHLPAGLQPRLLVGQGMNSNELAANPDLHQHFLQDLNLQPLLLDQLDASYDVVLCVNGMPYLTQPETVVAEASRVLKPGGLLVVAFGPHCFREKAFAGWLNRDLQERVQLLTEIIQANGFDTPAVLDSPAAAAALAQRTAQAQTKGASPAQPSHPAGGGDAAAAVVDAPGNGSSSSSSADLQLRVLVARKSLDWTAGAAEADTPGVEMRPDNVRAWFSKPGLAGLAEAASGGSQQQSGPQQPQSQQSLTGRPATSSGSTPHPSDPSLHGSPEAAAAAGADVGHAVRGAATNLTGGAVNARLLEQWHAAYASLAVDAVDLGIPRSVIPDVAPDASPAELQQAVQHLQDMMASFLSAGL